MLETIQKPQYSRPYQFSFIQTALLPLALFGLMSLSQRSFAQALPDDNSFQELKEIKSENGVLTATLEATDQKVQLGPISFDGYVYNGDYDAPLLRVHPGDVMRIHLVNHLADPTNIHYHGTHTSPLGTGDNIYVLVKPGDSFDYEIRIPLTQPPGLYWYHPHVHGISERMVNGGLSGALLVDGLKDQIPELAQVKEHIMILKQYEADEATSPELKRLHKLVQTLNGRLYSTVSMHKGETQLWQIVNPGPNYYFHLSVPGHKFRVIAWDGIATNQQKMVERLDIGPASRVAVLLDAGDQEGSFDLVSEQTPTGVGAERTDNRVLGSVVVDGGTAAAAVSEIKPFANAIDLRTQQIDKQRTVVFSEDAATGEYYIDGRKFDHTRIDTRIPLGTVEEWTLRNDSDDMHVFHIHQLHFQVVEINGTPQTSSFYLDTVRLPERGQVKIIIPFKDPVMVGGFVYHCHVLMHEDKGMMANIEVYDPAKENAVLTLWRGLVPQMQYAGTICAEHTSGWVDRLKKWI